ncbi:MAG: hypothetical protein ACRCVU_05060 [Flavobacterium sp.]
MSLETTKTAKIEVRLVDKYQHLLTTKGSINIDTLVVSTHHIDSIDKGVILLYINPTVNTFVRVGTITVESYMGTPFDIGEALSDVGIVVENFVFI